MIKNIVIGFLSLVVFYGIENGFTAKERRLKLAQLSFEEGCFTFAYDVCRTLKPISELGRCNNMALDNCGDEGLKWRNWLEFSKREK